MRKRIITGLSLVFLSFHLTIAQSGCDGSRYFEEVFSSFKLTSDVTYGSAIELSGATQSLEMDIREPLNDTANLRPLIVMAHGGSFLFGDKTQGDIVPMAETFAKRGYVTASIEYRLGMEQMPFPGPDSTLAMEAVLRAVHDAKAAVRFFYKDAATSKTYRIDTNHIYFMGSSAGAFIGLHYAYLDKWTEMPAAIDTNKASLSGGVEGNSGNPGYSSTIHGVVSYSGALGDSSWMEPADVPVMSLHGTADQVVPYGSAVIVLVNVYSLMEVDGSSSIHERARNLGMNECLYTFHGADHVPYVGNEEYTDTTLNLVAPFLGTLVCGGAGSCEYFVNVDEWQEEPSVQLYPNPTSGQLKIEMKNSPGSTVELWSQIGEVLGNWQMNRSDMELDLSEFPAGIYMVRVRNQGHSVTKKLLKL